MPEWARTILKWTAAIVVLGAVVAYAVPRALDELSQAVSFGTNSDAPTPAATPAPVDEPETTAGEAAAVTAASVRDGVVATMGPETVTLGGDGDHEVLLAFDPLPTDPACLTEVRLQVVVGESSGAPQVRVQPARITDLAALNEGEPLPADAAIEAGDAAEASAEESPDAWSWTVTAVYSIAAREAAPEAPVVLAVLVAPDSEGALTLTAATGDAEHAPRLSWTAVEGCPGVEAEGPQDA